MFSAAWRLIVASPSLFKLTLVNVTMDAQNSLGPMDAYTVEWDSSSIDKKFRTQLDTVQKAMRPVTVRIPGLAETYTVPFFQQHQPWLASRTFTSQTFFCPPNGHEGTITNLIGQLLHQNPLGSFMDVGSNLGFYSLLAVGMEHEAYTFDIQSFCLFNLKSLARMMPAGSENKLHIFNVGLSDTEQDVTNAEGGCDYENFYVAKKGRSMLDGAGTTVPVMRLDLWVESMNKQGKLKGPIAVLKMDTEGAEGRIALGMQKTLATCLIRNLIIELTPAHWYRFGQTDDDPTAIQAFADLVERHNYKAYFMFMSKERMPPAKMHNFIRPLAQHPTMPGQAGTGCYNTSYFEICDMKRFVHEYCLEFAGTVKRFSGTARGFCGNIWFQKQGC